jgi:hypothetical protein
MIRAPTGIATKMYHDATDCTRPPKTKPHTFKAIAVRALPRNARALAGSN